jgi:superfamily II DNA or RNA helicase
MTSLPDTLASRPPIGARWAASWPKAPRIVAESLLAVSDPLRTGLTAGTPARASDVARALARSLAPAEAAAAAPPWLLPGQARSFRRVLAALERHRGALLADPVGSGKTFVALAAAATLQGRRATACLVPATLAAQWRTVAEGLGIRVEIGTHQQASRGRLPAGTSGLVIIDECHHFRNPLTRRYAHTAPWLVGRPVLLLSATPVVNRMADLAHQLLLGVRDDALLGEGVVSVRAMLTAGTSLPALGHLVIEDTLSAGRRPARSVAVSAAGREEAALAARALAALARLQLSRHPPTAALVRNVLHRALASSPAALAAALRRYRALLLHARDAWRAGRALTRAELREFAGELDDQLVLWELYADGGRPVELALEDIEVLDVVLGQIAEAAAAEDPKVERLRTILGDGRPTLVFVTRRETVRHLRERLAPPAVAWCAGARAGLGRSPAPRAVVLDWFREQCQPSSVPGMPPRCLVVTDVAAEGLDLRRAERVVHYDLPWTPMRLEQREGRAVRLGSAHERIDVVRFLPPPAIDAALGMSEHLAKKAGLPARAGLGADGTRLWRWRSELADRVGDGPEAPPSGATAVVRGAAEPGLLAGFELLARGGTRAGPLSATIGWLGCDGRWNEAAPVVAERLMAAAHSQALVAAPAAAVRAWLDRLAGPIRQRLALAGASRWTAADPDPSARRLAARFGSAISEAARGRDQSRLARLERALAFTAGGHTAGEALLVGRLADADERELDRWTAHLPPPAARWDVIEVRLTGLVLFER